MCRPVVVGAQYFGGGPQTTHSPTPWPIGSQDLLTDWPGGELGRQRILICCCHTTGQSQCSVPRAPSPLFFFFSSQLKPQALIMCFKKKNPFGFLCVRRPTWRWGGACMDGPPLRQCKFGTSMTAPIFTNAIEPHQLQQKNVLVTGSIYTSTTLKVQVPEEAPSYQSFPGFCLMKSSPTSCILHL